MSADRYPSIFSIPMEAIFNINICIALSAHVADKWFTVCKKSLILKPGKLESSQFVFIMNNLYKTLSIKLL